MQTKQMQFWQSEFGMKYTDRNTFTDQELDRTYLDDYGVSRSEMNKEFLQGLSITNTLEVGCNVGNQLNLLQSNGFQQLYGIELQQYAVEKSKSLTTGINIIQGSAFDIPYKDKYFDLVYTSGVLIHISPDDITKIMDEMVRVSKRYIWGFEYFSEDYTHIDYRGEQEKMWKGNFAQMFLNKFPNLRLVKEKKYPYITANNIDQMYLLEIME